VVWTTPTGTFEDVTMRDSNADPTGQPDGSMSLSEIGSGLLTGPWVEGFWFSPGTALRSKSNFRRGPRQGAGEWGTLRRFEQTVATTARLACPRSWELGDAAAPVTGRPMIVSVVVARSLLDAGNFSKSLLDACEGVVFHTDASVVASTGLAQRGRLDQGCIAGFARLEPGSDAMQVADAVAALTRLVVNVFQKSV
jgi:hypothetical protein